MTCRLVIAFTCLIPLTDINAHAGEADLAKYKIAFNVLQDAKHDNYEVYLMNVDGSDAINLTNHPAVDWVYTAFEDKLYIVSDREGRGRKALHIYEMNWDGTGLRKLTPFKVVDSWISMRNHGNEFVITSAMDGAGHELYLIDRAGSVLRRLTYNALYENDPQFSPDGKHIVFRSKKSGKGELYTMPVDGGDWRRLTFYPEDDQSLPNGYGYYAGAPRWKPNSDLITFPSKRRGNYSIYGVKFDGTELRQLTPDGRDEMWHAWSPDGQWLVFDGSVEKGNYDIFLMPGQGGKIRRITTGKRAEQAPVFVRASP